VPPHSKDRKDRKDLGRVTDRHERTATTRITATTEAAKKDARQWTNTAHGKDFMHGKSQKASPCTPLPSVFNKRTVK
jgi:hypothetical protein